MSGDVHVASAAAVIVDLLGANPCKSSFEKVTEAFRDEMFRIVMDKVQQAMVDGGDEASALSEAMGQCADLSASCLRRHFEKTRAAHAEERGRLEEEFRAARQQDVQRGRPPLADDRRCQVVRWGGGCCSDPRNQTCDEEVLWSRRRTWCLGDIKAALRQPVLAQRAIGQQQVCQDEQESANDTQVIFENGALDVPTQGQSDELKQAAELGLLLLRRNEVLEGECQQLRKDMSKQKKENKRFGRKTSRLLQRLQACEEEPAPEEPSSSEEGRSSDASTSTSSGAPSRVSRRDTEEEVRCSSPGAAARRLAKRPAIVVTRTSSVPLSDKATKFIIGSDGKSMIRPPTSPTGLAGRSKSMNCSPNKASSKLEERTKLVEQLEERVKELDAEIMHMSRKNSKHESTRKELVQEVQQYAVHVRELQERILQMESQETNLQYLLRKQAEELDNKRRQTEEKVLMMKAERVATGRHGRAALLTAALEEMLLLIVESGGVCEQGTAKQALEMVQELPVLLGFEVQGAILSTDSSRPPSKRGSWASEDSSGNEDPLSALALLRAAAAHSDGFKALAATTANCRKAEVRGSLTQVMCIASSPERSDQEPEKQRSSLGKECSVDPSKGGQDLESMFAMLSPQVASQSPADERLRLMSSWQRRSSVILGSRNDHGPRVCVLSAAGAFGGLPATSDASKKQGRDEVLKGPRARRRRRSSARDWPRASFEQHAPD